MEIRKMKLEDYSEVYALWMSCKGMGLNDLDDSREGIARFLERNPDTNFVAVDDQGRIAGVILAGNDGRRGYIYHTAVRPDCRRQGTARLLVEKRLRLWRNVESTKRRWWCLRATRTGTGFGKRWVLPSGKIWFTGTEP